MSAYIIGRVNVNDWEQYRKYTERTPDAIARAGGRFIVRGGDLVTLEGDDETGRIVVIEFPSLAQAKAFYYSDEYQEIRKLRENAAIATLIAVDGV